MKINLPQPPLKVLQLHVAAQIIPQVLEALEGLIPSDQIKLLCQETLPSVEEEKKKAFEDLAQRIAKRIRPTSKQTMRLEALKFALMCGDTFSDWHGEGDPALRNALGALSKAMRPIFTLEASPIDKIARREKHFSNSGHYLGTSYKRTALGARVFEILKSQGIL